MSNALQTIHAAARPVGFLPIRVSPRFARLLRKIHQEQPSLAQQIREQVHAAMQAERQVRRLLARYRLTQRRGQLLRFPAPAPSAPQSHAG